MVAFRGKSRAPRSRKWWRQREISHFLTSTDNGQESGYVVSYLYKIWSHRVDTGKTRLVTRSLLPANQIINLDVDEVRFPKWRSHVPENQADLLEIFHLTHSQQSIISLSFDNLSRLLRRRKGAKKIFFIDVRIISEDIVIRSFAGSASSFKWKVVNKDKCGKVRVLCARNRIQYCCEKTLFFLTTIYLLCKGNFKSNKCVDEWVPFRWRSIFSFSF